MTDSMIFLSLTLWLSVSIAVVSGLSGLLENAPLYLFDPEKMESLVENSEQQVEVSCNRSSEFHAVTLKVISADPDIAAVSSDRVILCQCEPLPTSNISQFVIRGVFLGRTVINIQTVNATHLADNVHGLPLTAVNNSLPVVDYHVSVMRKERFIDHLFLGLVSIMVIFANIGMGCKIDLAVVKEVLKKPIAPAIGFSCQYLIMPLVCVPHVDCFFVCFNSAKPCLLHI